MNQQSLSQQEVSQIWDKARQQLKHQLSPAAFNTWILSNPLTEIEIKDQTSARGIISTPTPFHATNLKKNLYSQLKTAIEQVLQKSIDLEFKVQNPAELLAKQKNINKKQVTYQKNHDYQSSFNKVSSGSEQTSNNNNSSSSFSNFHTSPSFSASPNNSVKSSEPDSPTVDELFSEHNMQSMQQDQALTAARRAGLRMDYTFKSFAVSSSNEMAHAAATAVSKRPGQAYNPLFLYGGVGVGKTHLMHAVGHNILNNNPSIKVLYCTGEEFTNEIINAIRSKQAIKFKKKYRNTRVLLIDDIQFIAGKNTVQEEFFHTFNALVQNNAQIILTSDRPPHEINLLEDRLKSRFEAGLMVDIQQPSLELRTAIVLIKARAKNISFPINLAEKIAQSVDSARKIEGIITSIRSAVELRHQEINEELINSIIAKEKSLHPETKIRLKPQKIINKVCDYYQVKPSVIKGKKRNKEFVKPRHLAMFLLKTELNLSYVEIGRWFSNRDHTSVMHAKNKIEELIDEDENFKEEFQHIKQELVKISK